jgi:enoyl-CoA hydratase/carnithine racemase
VTGVVTLGRSGEVWTVSLNRSDKRNALSAELVEALLELMERAPRDGARVIVLRGEGRNFCAGFDLADAEQSTEGELVLRFIRLEMLLQAIASSPCLTVGFAHGRNFGAGVDLIAACRQRYGSADSTFRMPGLKFGLVLGTRRFGDIVGRERAASLQEEAATFDAREASDMGFLHGIVDQAEWPQVVEKARAKAAILPDWSRRALYDVLSSANADSDLAWLARSAARPGLKQRIAEYLRGP